MEALINEKKFCKAFYVESLNAKKLLRDFMALRSAVICVAETQKKHDSKCRYCDIMCPDSTRVVLQDRPSDNDFIHANWMTMPNGYRYISAQGPLDETTEDFWHMIFTEKSTAIVMICDWVEDEIQKCARYIPFDDCESRKFGIYKVTRVGQTVMLMDGVKEHTFEVYITEQPTIRHTVRHFHFVTWLDHTAPITSDSVLKVMKTVKELKGGPPVIHCSAGIGRTGTFIGVDYGIQRIGRVGELNPLDLVREMREMRPKAVQSHHQFLFMIICITDLMVLDGVPRDDEMDDIVDVYKEIMEKAKKRRDEKMKRKEESKRNEVAGKEDDEAKKKESSKIQGTPLRKVESNVAVLMLDANHEKKDGAPKDDKKEEKKDDVLKTAPKLSSFEKHRPELFTARE
uniref:Protein-tyrosine-phosphatase n=1 Tax=Caenorhabditis japonica TaxID=281687 RepID=A0A8R1EVW0_CAEJA